MPKQGGTERAPTLSLLKKDSLYLVVTSLKTKAYSAPSLLRTKRSFDGAVELRPAVLKSQFPENRENNREFLKFPPFRRLPPGSGVHLRCNSSALRTIPCSARNSEFVLPGTGNLSEEQRILQFSLADLTAWLCFRQK